MGESAACRSSATSSTGPAPARRACTAASNSRSRDPGSGGAGSTASSGSSGASAASCAADEPPRHRATPRPRSHATTGAYASAPSAAYDLADAVLAPRCAAQCRNSSTRRVLPTPGSPATTTRYGGPVAAARHSSVSRRRSAWRPTNTVTPLVRGAASPAGSSASYRACVSADGATPSSSSRTATHSW